MKNHRVIEVKYLHQTNHMGARISIREERFCKKDRVVISFDDDESNTLETAFKYLKSIGINIVGFGELKNSCLVFSDSWADKNGFISIKGEKF